MPLATLLLALLGPFAPVAVPAHPEPVVVASSVLHAWDAHREQAWATGDTAALRGLYVRGSPAGAADVRLLRSYADRGLVVRRLRTQYLALEVVHLDDRRLRVRLLERVAGGEGRDRGIAVPLLPTRAQQHEVVLRRVGGTWRVAAVSGSARAPRAARH